MNVDYTFDLFAVSPVLMLAFGAFCVLLLEVFSPPRWPRAGITLLVLLVAAAQTIKHSSGMLAGQQVFNGMVYADGFSSYFTLLIISATALAVLMASAKVRAQGIEAPGEYYSLLLMASAGAIIFVNAAEFLTFFLGLEIMSMALYALCGAALGKRISAESAMKYFLLGSFSSAFLLYGIAILYGVTGSMDFSAVASSLSAVAVGEGASQTLIYVGMALVLFGMFFKIGAVPFHFWAPDVYDGAPTSVTAFMACVVKVAAVGAMLRVLWLVFGDFINVWSEVVWLVACLTMVFGNLIALRQRSLKRMLAYSSIAHAGYILTAFLAPSETAGGAPAVMFYLVVYSIMTLGAFAVILAVADGEHSDDLTSLNGFSVKNPVLAALMALFMLSLAGIPPGLAGMLGKFFIFNAAVKAGYVGLAIIGVLSAAVSVYYYLRVIVAMYFVPSDDAASAVAVPVTLWIALLVCAALIMVVGVLPAYLYNWATFLVF